MEPVQPLLSQLVTIYKAPQKGKGKKLLEEGFQSADFPYNPPYFDGNCYFAGPNDRSIAEEFNQSYKGSISVLSVTLFALIPQPLLPEREKGSQSPSPSLGEGFRVRVKV